MKQIKTILIIALVGMIGIFTACEEDETTATLDITPKNVPDSIEVGVDVTLSFSVIVDEKIESIELRKGTTTLDTKTEGFSDNSSDAYTYTGAIGDTADAGSNLDMAIIVTDNKDNQETYNFEIYVKDNEINLTSHTDVEIEVAVDDGSNSSLFSLENGQTYVVNNISSDNEDLIDFVYTYSEEKAFSNQLLSPAETPSDLYLNGNSLPNTTNMSKVTDVDFSNVDGNAIVDNISNLSNTVISFTEGDIIAFITEYGHKGYLKVTTLYGTQGNSDSYIIVDVKAVLASDMP